MMQSSIIPTRLQLAANQHQIEQNQPVTLVVHLVEQWGNPVSNVDISLYVDHPDYGAPLLLSNQMTDVHGKALFDITLRSLGNTKLTAYGANLASLPVNVQVLPSSLPPLGPKTFNGVLRSLGRIGVDLNTVIGQEISQGHHPTKEELCQRLGLDYQRANDRNKVSTALYHLKQSFDYVWRVLYEQSPEFGKDFAKFMQDVTGYSTWKNASDSPYPYLKSRYQFSDEEIHKLWVTSQLWDNFVLMANRQNLHLFVAYYDADTFSHRYTQPNFWEYVLKQIESASHWAKAMLTILTRHRDLGMMLTSGEPIYKAVEGAETIRQMITEQTTPRFRCPTCWENGVKSEFRGTTDYFDHIKKKH
jgi:hypothetical protein